MFFSISLSSASIWVDRASLLHLPEVLLLQAYLEHTMQYPSCLFYTLNHVALSRTQTWSQNGKEQKIETKPNQTKLFCFDPQLPVLQPELLVLSSPIERPNHSNVHKFCTGIWKKWEIQKTVKQGILLLPFNPQRRDSSPKIYADLCLTKVWSQVGGKCEYRHQNGDWYT